MQCLACQHDNPADSAFCDECGARLEVRCQACGEGNRPSAKFCRACGGALTAASVKALSAPVTYTPPHLAERILTSRASLEGERKQVTVLFADLKGSMELLADRDPEQARRILDPVLERMMDAVHRYEGTVNQVMGDGVMALFGAPLSQEDHAVRACYAALRMQESIAKLGDELQRSHGVPVQLRVGLNSGEVVVRAIGNDLRMDYSAIGQTTHLAARMEQMAKVGTILLTPDTLKLVEGFAQVKSLGQMIVKGLSAPMEVFELLGASSARTRLQASTQRGLTRFVGRKRELDVITDAIDSARGGKGQAVAIVGEPGVGKSRLFHEFLHSHRTQGWTIAQAGSVSYGKATSYLPVIDLLTGYFRVGDRDNAHEIREKVIGKLLALDRALESLVAPLLSLLGQPTQEPTWEKLDPPQRRRQTLDALKRLWLSETQRQPLILVFEDLHWIDSESQTFLSEMMESVPASAVLMLFNYRPEYQHPWGSKTYYVQLRLDALSRENVDDLLKALLGTDASLRPLKDLLIARTDGNPFFLEEGVKTLIESGTLALQDGGARLMAPIETIHMPSTVQAILAARIDRLSPEDKRVLQTGSVIGKDVPYAVLQAIAQLSEPALRASLARLQAAEFLYEANLFPDLEYTFKHALTHEAAYGGLLQDRKRELHGGIVDAIEQIYGNRLDEQSERLAMHADRAEQWDKSRIYARQAAQRAFSRSANRDAVAWWEQALRASANGPQDVQTQRDTIDLLLEMRGALFSLGQMDRVVETIDAARARAAAIGDSYRVALALAYSIHPLLFTFRLDQAMAAGEEALKIAGDSGHDDVKVVTYCFLAGTKWTLGQIKEGESAYNQGLQLLGRQSTRSRFGMPAFPDVYIRGLLGHAISKQGRFAEAASLSGRGMEIADEEGHPYSQAHAYYMIGQIHIDQGDFDQGVFWCERSLEVCRSAQVPGLIPWASKQLARACLGKKEHLRAHQLLSETMEIFSNFGIRLGIAWAAPFLADAKLALGKYSEVLPATLEALRLTKETGAQFFAAELHRVLGDIYSHAHFLDSTLAEDHYTKALALSRDFELRGLAVQILLGFGRFLRQQERRDAAQAQLSEALKVCKEIELRYWPALIQEELLCLTGD